MDDVVENSHWTSDEATLRFFASHDHPELAAKLFAMERFDRIKPLLREHRRHLFLARLRLLPVWLRNRFLAFLWIALYLAIALCGFVYIGFKPSLLGSIFGLFIFLFVTWLLVLEPHPAVRLLENKIRKQEEERADEYRRRGAEVSLIREWMNVMRRKNASRLRVTGRPHY